MRIRRLILTMVLAAGGGGLAGLPGCGPLKAPEMPTPIASPQAQVLGVRRVEAGPDAHRYVIIVALTNPNDVALPMLDADYRLDIGDAEYRGDTSPNATLPASGRLTLELPAVVTADGNEYDVRGSLELDPPQQLKQVFYELGLPRPRANFAGRGEIEIAMSAAPPAAAAPGTPAPGSSTPQTPATPPAQP